MNKTFKTLKIILTKKFKKHIRTYQHSKFGERRKRRAALNADLKDHSSGTEEEFKSDSENESFEISDDSEPEQKKEKGCDRFSSNRFRFSDNRICFR